MVMRVEVRAKYGFSEMVDEHLMMLYKDNGVGMSAEAVENVFKAFYTTKRNKGGSGMGMHIVYSLIKEKFEAILYVPVNLIKEPCLVFKYQWKNCMNK